MRPIAHIISFIFHPLLIPSYLFLFLYQIDPMLLDDQINALRHQSDINPFVAQHFPATVFSIIMIVSFFFPVFAIFLMVKLGFVNNFYMLERRERILPLIAVSFFFFLNFYMVKNYFYLNHQATTAYFGAWLSVSIAFLFTLFYRVSLHAVGIGAMIGIALMTIQFSSFNLLVPIVLIIAIAGLVGWSRLKLDAHIPVELYSGYTIGLFAQLVTYRFY